MRDVVPVLCSEPLSCAVASASGLLASKSDAPLTWPGIQMFAASSSAAVATVTSLVWVA